MKRLFILHLLTFISIFCFGQNTNQKCQIEKIHYYDCIDSNGNTLQEPKLTRIDYYNSSNNRVTSVYFDDNRCVSGTTIFLLGSGGDCIGYADYSASGAVVNENQPKIDSATNEPMLIRFLDDYPKCNERLHAVVDCEKDFCGNIISVTTHSALKGHYLLSKIKKTYFYR